VQAKIWGKVGEYFGYTKISNHYRAKIKPKLIINGQLSKTVVKICGIIQTANID
jgi:hypothetical protein